MTAPVYVCDELGPTRAYRRRTLAVAFGDPAGDGRLATVTITQWKQKDGAEERDRYALVEQPAIGFRSFLWLNESDESQPDVYESRVGDRGAECTCKAGSCRVEGCKHRAACLYLIAKGYLPPPPVACVETPAPVADAPVPAGDPIWQTPGLKTPEGLPF